MKLIPAVSSCIGS